MEACFNYVKAAPEGFKSPARRAQYLEDCGHDHTLLNLVFRVAGKGELIYGAEEDF